MKADPIVGKLFDYFGGYPPQLPPPKRQDSSDLSGLRHFSDSGSVHSITFPVQLSTSSKMHLHALFLGAGEIIVQPLYAFCTVSSFKV